MRRLEEITSAYWAVGTALRHPDAPPLACGVALDKLGESDRLRPEEWKLAEEMHVLMFDIIEGNDEWREKRKVQNSTLIQFTRN